MEKSREGAVRASTHHVVEAYTPALKEDLPREAIDKGKPELEHKQRDGRESNNDGRGVSQPGGDEESEKQ